MSLILLSTFRTGTALAVLVLFLQAPLHAAGKIKLAVPSSGASTLSIEVQNLAPET